jgi:hypothetical protein
MYKSISMSAQQFLLKTMEFLGLTEKPWGFRTHQKLLEVINKIISNNFQ